MKDTHTIIHLAT